MTSKFFEVRKSRKGYAEGLLGLPPKKGLFWLSAEYRKGYKLGQALRPKDNVN